MLQLTPIVGVGWGDVPVSDGLVAAAGSGDRRLALVALRAVLAAAIATCQSTRDLPGLARQLSAVLAELDDLGEGVVSAADQIAARRRGIR
jgi:hypothetical protein